MITDETRMDSWLSGFITRLGTDFLEKVYQRATQVEMKFRVVVNFGRERFEYKRMVV